MDNESKINYPAQLTYVTVTSPSCHNSFTPPKDNREKDIDDVFVKLRPYGPFQIILEITMVLVMFTTCYNFMLSYFTADNPPWKCINNNSSYFCWLHSKEIIHSNSDVFEERCKLRREEWTYTTSKHYSYVTEFDLICEKTSTAAFASSAFFIGGVLGSMFAGAIADAYGRKPVIFYSICVTICSSFACTFVNTVWQLTGINIVLGAAVVACCFITILYLSEFTSHRYQSILCNMSLVATASFMVMVSVAYSEQNWRSLQRYLAISAIFPLIVFTFLPESPRWLLEIGKQSKAVDVFKKIYKFNGNPNVAINLKPTFVSNEKKYTYLDLCRNFKIILLTLSLGIICATAAIMIYSIALQSSNVGGNMYKAFACSTLADIPAVIICTYICNRFGRKYCTLGSLFTSGTLISLVAIIPHSISYRYIINIAIMMSARFFAMITFLGIFTWTSELYPTVLRSQGMTVCAVFQRIGLVVVPFIANVLQRESYALPFFVMCVLAIVASVIGVMLPETNKQPPRETHEDIFDMKITKQGRIHVFQ